MSVKCMARVWAESTVGGSELLVLLAIADHAHDDGSGAWPSLNTLARKTKMSRRNVIRVVNQLVAKGELQRDSGAGPYGTNAYVVLTGVTKHSRPILKCYLCGEPGGNGIVIENHHPNPEDRSFTVPLCKTCHIKVHKLLGGDNLSPPTDSGDKLSPPIKNSDAGVTPTSDSSTQGVTPQVKTGDTAMAPDPSLTIKKEPSIEPSLEDPFSSLWSPFLDALKGTMTKQTFDTWLLGSRLIDATNGTWIVQLPKPHAVEWVGKRLYPGRSFQSLMRAHAPDVQEIKFVAKEKIE